MVAVLALLLLTAIWGYTFVPAKEATEVVPVLAFLVLRFAVASGALGLVTLPRLRRLGREGWVHGSLIGVTLAASLLLQTAGLHRTSVSSTGFITGLYVVLTPLLGVVLYRHRIGWAGWAGAALSIAGLGLIAGAPGNDLVGDLLVLGSCLTQAFQILFIGRWAERHDGLALSAVEVLSAALLLLAAAAATGDLRAPHGGTVWYGVLVTALPATAIAMWLQIWVQQRVPPARAAVLFTLEVPFAALFGIVLLGDDLGVLGWLGGALMLVAILVSEPPVVAWVRGRLGRPAGGARGAAGGRSP